MLQTNVDGKTIEIRDMPIKLQTARVALIFLAAILFSGSISAAEPSYDDLLAQIRSGKLDVDYAALRLSFAASPKYEPYGSVTATIMAKRWVALRLGEPLSKTRTTMLLLLGPWPTAGVQLKRPLAGSRVAPLGAERSS